MAGVRLWWAPASDDKGKIMAHSDNSPYDLLLGGCDNASRVVSYVVVMGQGYDSSPLLDMRIHDISVEADPNKHAPSGPDPVEADGSNPGASDLQSDESEDYFNDKLGEAHNMISLYWTGWWPTLHFVIQQELMTDVVLSIHLTVDILGSVGIENFNVEFLGVEDMTEPEADDVIGRFRPATAGIVRPSNPYRYFLGIGAVTYTSARIIALFCPPGAAQVELIVMGMLGLGAALIIMGLLLLAQAVAENQTDPFLAALTFLGIALTALLVLGTSMKTIDKMGGQSTGAAKYFRFFKDRYQNGNGWDEIGLQGRTHWMLMFTQILILCTIILIALAFIAGAIYDVFF